MKKIEIPQADEFQTFRPSKSRQSTFADALVDIFSEPRLPVRSKKNFGFDKFFGAIDSLKSFEPAETTEGAATDTISGTKDSDTTIAPPPGFIGGANDSDTTIAPPPSPIGGVNDSDTTIAPPPGFIGGANDSDTTIAPPPGFIGGANDSDTTIAPPPSSPIGGVNDSDTTITPLPGDEIASTDKTKKFGPRHPRFYENVSLNKAKTILKASVKFAGGLINLADFDPKVRKVNAASVKEDVDIIGNDSDNSLKGGAGDDTLIGGEGNDTLTGGSGENTFIYESGNDLITDYTAKKDKIQIEAGGITNVSSRGTSVVFTFAEGGTLTIKNGKNKNITLVDEDDNEITEKFTAKNIDKAETLLADLWFTPEVENFANEGDQQFDAILKDNEDYSSLGGPDIQPPTTGLTKSNKFKPELTFSRSKSNK